ncbi:MAG: hypothetical protein A2W31_11915 [Planctomycetes bacterium RBG_16_64_10]|nr:MAG: hypothetical protein A2W31_11915 [Planctomycetes bacterium RBG_16_64_10]
MLWVLVRLGQSLYRGKNFRKGKTGAGDRTARSKKRVSWISRPAADEKIAGLVYRWPSREIVG